MPMGGAELIERVQNTSVCLKSREAIVPVARCYVGYSNDELPHWKVGAVYDLG